jgi:hypothetical protein
MMLYSPGTCLSCRQNCVLDQFPSPCTTRRLVHESEDRVDLLHLHCLIKRAVYVPTCPHCRSSTLHCPGWRSLVETNMGLAAASNLARKIWETGVRIQLFTQLCLGITLNGYMLSPQICGHIAASYLKCSQRIWILPLVIFLNMVEFALRFTLLIMLTAFVMSVVNSSSWLLLLLCYVVIARLSDRILNQYLTSAGLAVPWLNL